MTKGLTVWGGSWEGGLGGLETVFRRETIFVCINRPLEGGLGPLLVVDGV